jgi:AraC family transcriptional regulator, transcriptional activator FtrA
MSTHLVAALAYEGLCTFEFGCTVEVFALERPELGVPWYRFAVCAERPGELAADGGVSIRVRHSLRLLQQADTIVIPGWRKMGEPPSPQLIRALQRAHGRGARLCSICSGVFLLAAAGLLDGKRATTHWKHTEQLRQRHPLIQVEPNALYVDEGQVLTSAGSAAGLDMLLHVVRKDYGARVANQVAQRLVIPPHREGGQAQFIPRPVSEDERGRLSRLLDFMRAHLEASHTLASLAARAAMSPRTLQREFRAATGLAPSPWLTRERVARARELLETSRLPPERIAQVVGLKSEESLRHHFRRQVGAAPARYRRQFTRTAG